MGDAEKSGDKKQVGKGPADEDWLNQLLKQKSFDASVIKNIPVADEPLENLFGPDNRAEVMTSQIETILLGLVKHPDQSIRDAVSDAISKADSHSLSKQVANIAFNPKEEIEFRISALEALKNSSSESIICGLAKFLVDYSASRISIDSLIKNRAIYINVHATTEDLKEVLLAQKKDLLLCAAESIREFKSKSTVDILDKFASKGTITRIWEAVKGVSADERQMHLEAIIHALIKPVEVETKLISKLFKEALKSDDETLMEDVLNMATVKPTKLTESNRQQILNYAKSIIARGNFEESPENQTIAIYSGKILSHSTSPKLQNELRGLLQSNKSTFRLIALYAFENTRDLQDLKTIAGILERSDSLFEQNKAIEVLGNALSHPED